MSDLSERLQFINHLDEYLNELETVFGKSFCENDLIPLNRNKARFNHDSNTVFRDKVMIKMPFHEKGSKRFQSYIKKINGKANGVCYFYSRLSRDCGPVAIDSIFEFNFNFKFEYKGAIITFEWENSKDNFIDDNAIHLDWYTENGNQILELELEGDITNINYDSFERDKYFVFCRYSKEDNALIEKIGNNRFNSHFPKGLYFATKNGLEGRSQMEILSILSQERFNPFYTWIYQSSNQLIEKLQDKQWVDNMNRIFEKVNKNN